MDYFTLNYNFILVFANGLLLGGLVHRLFLAIYNIIHRGVKIGLLSTVNEDVYIAFYICMVLGVFVLTALNDSAELFSYFHRAKL